MISELRVDFDGSNDFVGCTLSKKSILEARTAYKTWKGYGLWGLRVIINQGGFRFKWSIGRSRADVNTSSCNESTTGVGYEEALQGSLSVGEDQELENDDEGRK